MGHEKGASLVSIVWTLLIAVVAFFAGYFTRPFLKKQNPEL